MKRQREKDRKIEAEIEKSLKDRQINDIEKV
jgi:hypothetical protein